MGFDDNNKLLRSGFLELLTSIAPVVLAIVMGRDLFNKYRLSGSVA